MLELLWIIMVAMVLVSLIKKTATIRRRHLGLQRLMIRRVESNTGCNDLSLPSSKSERCYLFHISRRQCFSRVILNGKLFSLLSFIWITLSLLYEQLKTCTCLLRFLDNFKRFRPSTFKNCVLTQAQIMLFLFSRTRSHMSSLYVAVYYDCFEKENITYIYPVVLFREMYRQPVESNLL